MVLAMKSGLDSALAYKVLTDGAGNSRRFRSAGRLMVKGRLFVGQRVLNVR